MLSWFNNKEQGFTLAELLVATLISGVILGAIATTFVAQSKIYDAQEQVTEMVQSARAAMDMMSREIRLAGYDPTGANFTGITYNTSQLEVRTDLDGDGDTSDSNEDITYTYDSSNLQIYRNTGGGAQPLAENIQSFTFAYLDSTGTATTTSANVRQVQITITARTDKADPDYSANSGYRTYTLTSYITPKNLAF